MTTITITYDNGKLGLQSTTGDLVLMYGILELTKDAIRQQAAAAQSRIVAPEPGMAGMFQRP